MSTNSDEKYRRPKRKQFLVNVRKYGKKGCYGRGREVDKDTYDYFIRILETHRDGFDSKEEELLFANNFFEQINEQEINYSCNQVGCRIIEKLLPLANDAILDRFITSFSDDLRRLCSDRFASHVMEMLVKQTHSKSLITDEKTIKIEFNQKCKNFVLKMSKFLLNNLEDFIWNTYGNHIIRTCLRCMAQIPEEKQHYIRDTRIKRDTTVIIPSEYEDVIKDYGERIFVWPQFSELCNNEITSAFLQILLKSIKQIDKKLLLNYLKKLLNENFITVQESVDYNLLPPVFLSKPLIMLLETSIQVAKKKMFTQIYIHCFLNRLSKLATMTATNFTVQKLIACCEEQTEFEAIFEELKDNFKQIIDVGNTGILLALGRGCVKFATKQAIFLQNLMKSLNCFEPEDRENRFIICLASFRTYETIQDTFNIPDEKLSLHGNLILQLLLEFNKPIKIVNGLLNMETKTLKDLFCNVNGCYIVASFVNSDFVGEKSRDKLIKKLQGNYQQLVLNKYGSRAFEDLWNVANLANKMQIMDEIVEKDGIWSNTPHGRMVAIKINLDLYKRHKGIWRNSLNVSDKTNKLFEGIVD